MRPLEYRDYLRDLLKGSAGVQQAEALETGPYPYALSVTVAGRELRWQVYGRLAEGAKHAGATPSVQGEPPAYTAVPAHGAPDAWLAGAIGAAAPTDTERIEAWSTRGDKSPHGVTVCFRNGERVFLRLAWTGSVPAAPAERPERSHSAVMAG